jgi:hypothetical protein
MRTPAKKAIIEGGGVEGPIKSHVRMKKYLGIG